MNQLISTEDRAKVPFGAQDQTGEPAQIVSLTGDMDVERSPANAGVQIECREGCRW